MESVPVVGARTIQLPLAWTGVWSAHRAAALTVIPTAPGQTGSGLIVTAVPLHQVVAARIRLAVSVPMIVLVVGAKAPIVALTITTTKLVLQALARTSFLVSPSMYL